MASFKHTGRRLLFQEDGKRIHAALAAGLISKDRGTDNKEEAKLLAKFDKDKSGYIDPQELVAALTMLGVKRVDGIEDADGDNRLSLKDLDKDGDQKISFEEFKVVMAGSSTLCCTMHHVQHRTPFISHRTSGTVC